MRAENARQVLFTVFLGVTALVPGARCAAQTPGSIAIARDSLNVTLSWDSVPGRSYLVLSTTDLALPWDAQELLDLDSQ